MIFSWCQADEIEAWWSTSKCATKNDAIRSASWMRRWRQRPFNCSKGVDASSWCREVSGEECHEPGQRSALLRSEAPRSPAPRQHDGRIPRHVEATCQTLYHKECPWLMRQGLELTTANEVQADVGEDSVVLPLRAAWGGGLGGSLRVFIKYE